MKDLLVTAILRLAIYLAPVAFGAVGGLIAWLGIGLYDAEAGTITMTLAQFNTAVALMVGSGGTAIVALIKGWRARQSE
jgi:TRAP-type C4-dicarboxylate transport system permease small subunit